MVGNTWGSPHFQQPQLLIIKLLEMIEGGKQNNPYELKKYFSIVVDGCGGLKFNHSANHYTVLCAQALYEGWHIRVMNISTLSFISLVPKCNDHTTMGDDYASLFLISVFSGCRLLPAKGIQACQMQTFAELRIE